MSLRGEAEANPEIPRSARNKLRNPVKNEIATPFGLAMTTCDVKIFNAFVLVQYISISYSAFYYYPIFSIVHSHIANFYLGIS